MAETSLKRSRSVTLGGQENPPHLLSHRTSVERAAGGREGNALPDVTQIGAAGVLLRLPGVITGSHNTQP